MNTSWTCEYCNKKYKRSPCYNKHIEKCERKTDIEKKAPEKKGRKKKISPHVRFEVWKTYIGNNIKAECFCCWKNKITPFTYCNTFHAGHIHSEAKGGEIKIENLLPICSDCNKSMGTTHWDEYIKKYTNFRIRIYGEKLPKKAHQKAVIIQRLCKKYLEKKKKINKKKKKKKKKKIPNYLRPTRSFLKKLKKRH
jgi:hypothetical protein